MIKATSIPSTQTYLNTNGDDHYSQFNMEGGGGGEIWLLSTHPQLWWPGYFLEAG